MSECSICLSEFGIGYHAGKRSFCANCIVDHPEQYAFASRLVCEEKDWAFDLSLCKKTIETFMSDGWGTL